MMRITIMAIFLSVCSYAQNTYSINGIVKDKKTGELISGAVIKVKELPEISITTNEYGFYSISLPENDYTFTMSHDRHQDALMKIHLNETKKVDWNLGREDETMIEEVVIKNSNKNKVVSVRNRSGAEVMDIQGVRKLPVLLGERDIIKTLQFLPGVSAKEGSTGLSIRGGNTDQNLILLDEAPTLNNSHLFGLFSIFNSDILKDVTLYKGNMPSQYGGRLSSIIDVKVKDGNNQKFAANGGISTMSGRLSLEGPIVKGKSSFIISARRSFMDIFSGAGGGEEEDSSDKEKSSGGSSKFYFYDFNAKVNYQINKNNTLYLSGYLGRDVFNFDDFKYNWGNKIGSLSWNSIVTDKLFSKSSLIFSNYDYRMKLDGAKDIELDLNPNVRNLMFKQDFSHYIHPKHSLKYGFQISNYYFDTPNLSKSVESPFLKTARSMWENAVYINDDYKLSDKLSFNYGVRLSMYNSKSKGSEKFQETDKLNVNVEPRIMVNYSINSNNSINASYIRNTQGLQTLSGNSGNQLNDLWINLAKPQTSDQVNLGYVKKFKKGYEISTDIYYRKMSNIVDYKDGLDVNAALFEPDFQNNLLQNGVGRAYGLEILAKKTTGKFTGWLSYSLSKSERKIEGINNGNWYNASSDKTHSLSVVGSYEFTPRWTFSGAFVYSTGSAMTYPVAKYEVDGQTMLEYGARNSNRMPAYHRLDLSVSHEFKNAGRFKKSLIIGAYNVYGRANPFSVDFKADENNPGIVKAKQSALFRFIPSIGFDFKF
jgi:hypothetical protein